MCIRLITFSKKNKGLCNKPFRLKNKFQHTEYNVWEILDNIYNCHRHLFVLNFWRRLITSYYFRYLWLFELNHLGKKFVTNLWFKSYISNRKQYVAHNGSSSTLKSFITSLDNISKDHASFLYNGVKLWNELPSNIRKMHQQQPYLKKY